MIHTQDRKMENMEANVEIVCGFLTARGSVPLTPIVQGSTVLNSVTGAQNQPRKQLENE